MITIRCTNKEKPAAHTLLVGKTYKIGRKNHEINMEGDHSISREHATIMVEHPMANMTDPLLTPMVVLTDLGSKFGTFANDGIERKSKMAMREALNLTPGDRFKCGLQWNEYKIEYTPLVVTPSAVKEAALKELKRAVMTLGGHLVQEWVPGCDYVIMDAVTLTVKVVCALVAGKYIVTPVFFQDMLQAIIHGKPLPNPNNFLPPVLEKNIEGHSWEPYPARSVLFKGKTFVFCGTKHMKKLALAVELGGGTCKLVGEVSNKDLLKENVILVKPSDRDLIVADSFTRTALDLYKKTKRPVPDSEIGMAALFCSTDRHCNPYHTFSDREPLPRIPSQSQNPDKNTVVAPATQEMETQLSYVPGEDNSNRQVVDETIVEDNSKAKDGKRQKDMKVKDEPMSIPKKEETKDDEPPSKKRPAEEALSRLREKRLRPEAVPRTPQRSTRSTQNTQRSDGGLSAIFGMSDDEDDGDIDIIPATQAQSQGRKRGQEQEQSATMDPTSDVDVIPASPEISDQDEIPTVAETESVFKSPERRATRLQARTSPQIVSPPAPLQPRASSSRAKRKIVESSPETSPVKIEQVVSKKQKTKQTKESIDNENLVQKAEKLTIKPDVKEILNQIEGAPKTTEVHVSLLKAPKIEPKIEVVNGKTVKNFKTFQKVLPLSMQQHNVSFASGSSRGGKGGTNSSAKSCRSMKVTFVDYEHTPTISGSCGNNRGGRGDYHRTAVEDVVQENQRKRRITREEENDMEIEDIMPDTHVPSPLPASPISNTRSSRRTTRKPVDPPRRQDSPEPVEIERAPPRQRKKVQKVILSDDEDDDMFQF